MLFAANNTPIQTFVEKLMLLDLHLRQPYKWIFVIADVAKLITGADFLKYHNLLSGLRDRRLTDATTRLSTPGRLVHCSLSQIWTVAKTTPYTTYSQKAPRSQRLYEDSPQTSSRQRSSNSNGASLVLPLKKPLGQPVTFGQEEAPRRVAPMR